MFLSIVVEENASVSDFLVNESFPKWFECDENISFLQKFTAWRSSSSSERLLRDFYWTTNRKFFIMKQRWIPRTKIRNRKKRLKTDMTTFLWLIWSQLQSSMIKLNQKMMQRLQFHFIFCIERFDWPRISNQTLLSFFTLWKFCLFAPPSWKYDQIFFTHFQKLIWNENDSIESPRSIMSSFTVVVKNLPPTFNQVKSIELWSTLTLLFLSFMSRLTSKNYFLNTVLLSRLKFYL